MRHFSDDHAAEAGEGDTQALKIVYPPDGARIDLGLSAPDSSDLALKAEGGVPPLRWMVNGAPVGTPDPRRQFRMDAGRRGLCPHFGDGRQGASDSVQVRLQ